MRIKEISIIDVIYDFMFVAIVVGLSWGGYEIATEIMKPLPVAMAQSSVVDTGRAVGVWSPTGYQTLTPNSTTASSLTPTIAGQSKAFITIETNSVRFRIDGTSPTTTEGHLVTSGSNITLNTIEQILKFKVISPAAHGVLKITYGK